MEASGAPATDPGAAGMAASEPQRALSDLLPTGRARVAVALGGAGLLLASFAVFGASSRALVGAVLCPVLVLLAAIDARHRLLPNAIVFPSVLALGLVLAATDAD